MAPVETWQSALLASLPLLPRTGVVALAEQLRRGGPDLCDGVSVFIEKDGRVRCCPVAYAAVEGDTTNTWIGPIMHNLCEQLPDPDCENKATRLRVVMQFWDDMHKAGYAEDAREQMLEVIDGWLAERSD